MGQQNISKARTPRLYTLWSEMHELCRNPHHPLYASYGGRGIGIAPEWWSFAVFRQWALATGYHRGAFMLRLEQDAAFTPDNCAWTSLPEQAEIGHVAPRLLVAFGLEMTVEAWGRDAHCRVSVSTLRKRLAAGWTMERALTTPARPVPHFTAFGETKTAIEWARDPRCAVNLSTLRGRLAQGWDNERALITPTTETRDARRPRYTAFGETKSRTEWLQDPRCLVTRATLRHRLGRGWELERALTTPTDFARDIHPVTAFGETKTLLAWAHDSRCVIGERGLLTRLQQGWLPEEALTIPGYHDDQRTLVAFGERKTLADWLQDARCRANARVVRHRLREGWEAERALTMPGGFNHNGHYTAFGETKTVAGWSADERCRVPHIVLLQRLRRGWPLEQSLATIPHHSTRRTALTAFGETKSLAAWVRDPRCVVAPATVSERLSRGWSLEEALTHAPLPYPHSQALCAFGETKPMAAWLEDVRCLVGRDAIKYRLAQGWSVEDALATPPGARRGRRLTAFGLTQSLQAWTQDKRCRVSVATLTARLTTGWPLEEALTTPPFERLPQLTAFGDTLPISAWIADPRCIVSRATLLERLREGWPADRALATPSRHLRTAQRPTTPAREEEAVGVR